MFTSQHVTAMFKKATLKIANADGQPTRIAEATLVIEPFGVELARELGEDIAGHLFTEDDAIRPELETVTLRVGVGLQRVSVKRHLELQHEAVLENVRISGVKVTRIEDEKAGREWLQCQFVLSFSLEGKAARTFVLDDFGSPLLWTFEALQADLLNQAAIHDAIGRMVPGGTTMTMVVPGLDPVTLTQENARAHRAKARELRQQAAE